MNSRNFLGKGFKTPLSMGNCEEMLSFWKKPKDICSHWQEKMGIPLHRTKTLFVLLVTIMFIVLCSAFYFCLLCFRFWNLFYFLACICWVCGNDWYTKGLLCCFVSIMYGMYQLSYVSLSNIHCFFLLSCKTVGNYLNIYSLHCMNFTGTYQLVDLLLMLLIIKSFYMPLCCNFINFLLLHEFYRYLTVSSFIIDINDIGIFLYAFTL